MLVGELDVPDGAGWEVLNERPKGWAAADWAGGLVHPSHAGLGPVTTAEAGSTCPGSVELGSVVTSTDEDIGVGGEGGDVDVGHVLEVG